MQTGKHTSNIELQSCIMIVEEIEKKGFCAVARPQNCIEKVKRCLDIDLVVESYFLRFKQVDVFTDENGQMLMFNLNRVI